MVIHLRLKNENIRGKLKVAPIEDKMRENRVRWFDHVQRRFIDATVRRIDRLEVTGASRGGGRRKKTWKELVRNDLMALNLIDKIDLYRTGC